MLRFLIVCVWGALFWISGSLRASAESAPECQLTRLATVKTDTMPDGRVKIPVMIEDHPLSFMVDTGGVATTIKWEQAKPLGLAAKQTSQGLMGVAGSMSNFYVTGNAFSVGDLHVKNQPIYLETRALDDADGTFGSDMLKGYDVEFDFAHDSLSLISQDHCPGQVVDWTTTGFIVIPIDVAPTGHVSFPVNIDGKSIMATLDTGSAISSMSMKAAAELGIDPKAPELTLIGDTGQYQIFTYPFHLLDFGRVSARNPHIVITSDNFTKGLDSHLVLGIETLRQMHLYIAYGEKRLYITAAQAN